MNYREATAYCNSLRERMDIAHARYGAEMVNLLWNVTDRDAQIWEQVSWMEYIQLRKEVNKAMRMRLDALARGDR